MLSLCWLLGLATAGEVQPAPAEEPEAAAQAPSEAQPAWRGGARSDLVDVVALEAQMREVGADPERASRVAVSLDWGTLVTDHPAATDGDLAFTDSELQVSQARLSDGLTLTQGQRRHLGVIEADRDEERARLCTRLLAEQTGENLRLHTWNGSVLGESDQERRDRELSFVVAENEDDSHTLMVDLAPGESATVVELSTERPRRLRARRAVRIDREERSVVMTEGDDTLSRICLEY